jgi:NADH-quinone oxidoreductase subunit J
MSWVEAIFVLLSLVALGSALLVVTTPHLVHAALWLVVTLGSVAGIFLVLAAEFVAWVQVLIYVGAVVVLLLFGLMLTRAPIGVSDELDSGPWQRVLAALVAGATAGVLVTTLVDGFKGARIELPGSGGSARALGGAVFQSWVLPFELLSVLLLAALIGAVVLSRQDVGPPADDAPAAEVEV